MTWYLPLSARSAACVYTTQHFGCLCAQIEQCDQHHRSRAEMTARLHAFLKYDENQVMVCQTFRFTRLTPSVLVFLCIWPFSLPVH